MMTRYAQAIAALLGVAVPLAWLQLPSPTVATELQLPGTQPLEATLQNTPQQCDNCHGGFDPIAEPNRPWSGGMMAHAARDPVFWATLAVAEQDHPGSGDYCLRCHTPRGWLEGRVGQDSRGAALVADDAFGVECAVCHQLADPDGAEHPGVQNVPYVANDGGNPPDGYHGNAMMAVVDGNARYGPYDDANSPHASVQSVFHRDAAICGTCHDVSNPVTGDLAPGNGHEVPLAPGTFSGVPGAPVTDKAAFRNLPFRYGIVERTFSEHQVSAFADLAVADYDTLPAELRRGILAKAREQALLAGPAGDYADGTTRRFGCQTCHMLPVVGKGAKQSYAPVRTDLPTHDLTGGNTWVPDLIRWADQNGRLTFGGGLDAAQLQQLDVGRARARQMLRMAAALDVDGDELRVVNLTGHKLFSGYPEGRRMWLRVHWRDANGNVVRVDGDYGELSVVVSGTPHTVESLLDPEDANLHIYEAKFGLTRQWAGDLLALGMSASLPLTYDRIDGSVTMTLGQLAAMPPGSEHESFHFVLNDTVVEDSRIPPYGMDHDGALARGARPVPASLYGDPGSGGVYEHFDRIALAPPAGAVRAGFELLYQTASWEYVQFLLLANDGSDPFLGAAGQDLFDGWRATGMSPPETMATAAWCEMPGTGDDLSLRSGVVGDELDTDCAKTVHGGEIARFELVSPNGALVGEVAAIAFQVYPEGGPWPLVALPGFWLDRVDHAVPFFLAPQGNQVDVAIPPGNAGLVVRVQGVAISALTLGGFLGTSPAHDAALR